MEQRTGSSAGGTVDDYLAALPEKERAVLQGLRETIRSAAPEAEEVISYRIPRIAENEVRAASRP